MLQRREGAGSFTGDPDRQRYGSFADSDRVVIVTSPATPDARGSPASAEPGGSLRRAALDDDAVDRAVGELHEGHAILLIDFDEIGASEADARLEKLARAA